MKKILVTLMCVAMVLALMPAVAFAGTGDVAKIGDTKYTSLKDAIEDANRMPTGTTVTMLDDWAYPTNGEELLNITNSIILDGNGHKITGYGVRGSNKTTLAINQGGTSLVEVTLKNLTIENSGSNGRPIETRGNITKLNIENCHFSANGSGNTQVLTIGGNQSTKAEIIINKSTLSAGNSGYPIIMYNPVKMTIDNSSFKGYCSLYFKGVDGSEGSHGSVVNANNASFDAPNEHATTTESRNDFGAFVFEDDNISLELDSCKINVEEKNTATQAVVLASSCSNSKSNGFTVTLKGDTSVNGRLLSNDEWDNPNCCLNIESGDYTLRAWTIGPNDKAFNITGGTFNMKPNTSYLGKGYEFRTNGNNYIVGKHELKAVADTSATCVKAGIKEHYKCEFCGKLYSDLEGTNEVTADSLVIAATGNHTYGNWTTVKAATCADKGTEKRVCSVCDKEETREVAATGKHIFKDSKCTVCKSVDPDAPTHTPIDTTKPVEDVAVGVAKDDVKEAVKVVDDTAKSIVDAVEAGKTAEDLKNIVDKKVVDAIANVAAGSDVKVTTSVIAKSVEKNDVGKKTIALVAEGSDKSTVAQYLDLSVMVNVVVDGKVVETGEIKQLSKPITFTIAIPEELKTVKEGVTRTYYVIRVHGNEVTKIPTTVNADGTLSFETDRFSTYALAYEDTAKTTTTPKTGDATNMLPWLLLMALAGAGAVVFKKKED